MILSQSSKTNAKPVNVGPYLRIDYLFKINTNKWIFVFLL